MKISRQSGFTIVEMLIVLVIIAMLMPSVYDLWRSNFIAFTNTAGFACPARISSTP